MPENWEQYLQQPPQASSPSTSEWDKYLPQDVAGGPSTQAEVRSAPPLSWQERVALPFQEFARGALTTLGLPGYVLPRAKEGALSSEAFADPSGFSAPYYPTSGELLRAAHLDLEPYAYGQATAAERIGARAAFGVGASVPLMPVAGPWGAVAGGIGGAASQAATEAGLPVAASEGLGDLAGFAGGGVGSFAMAPLKAGARDFATADIPLRSRAYTDDGLFARWLAAGAPREATQQDLGSAVEAIAEAHGKSRNWEDAGLSLQPAAQKWRDSGMASEIEAAAQPMDALVPPSANHDVSELQKRFQDLLTSERTANVQAAQGALGHLLKAGGGVKQVAQDLKTQVSNPLGGGPAAPTDWATGRLLRTNLGDYLASNRDPAQKGALDYLYGGATQDLGDTAAAHGAADEFAHFNQVSTQAHSFDDGPVERILSSSSPEKAALNIRNEAKVGSTNWDALQARFPSEMRELAAANLRMTGLENPSQAESKVSRGFGTYIKNIQASGSLDTMYPSDASALGAAGRIASKWTGPTLTYADAARVGGLAALGGIGGYLLGGSGDEHEIRNLLLGEALGGALPAVGRLGLARSGLAARLGSRQWGPLGLAASSSLGALPPAPELQPQR